MKRRLRRWTKSPLSYRSRQGGRGTSFPSRRKSSSLFPRLLFIGIFILLVIFFLGDHGVYRLVKIKREKAKLLDEIDRLREEQMGLLAEKDRLEQDFEYIEQLAREKYRMAKPEEKVFRVVPEELPLQEIPEGK